MKHLYFIRGVWGKITHLRNNCLLHLVETKRISKKYKIKKDNYCTIKKES